MPTDINQLPKKVLTESGPAPHPVFTHWWNSKDNVWVPFNAAPKYPWKNFNIVERPWLSAANQKYVFALGELGSLGGLTLFRANK